MKKEEESDASSVGDYDSEDSFIDNEEDDFKPKKRGVANKRIANGKRGTKKEEYSEDESFEEELPKKKPAATKKSQKSEEETLLQHVEDNLKADFNPDGLTISELK